MLEVLAYRTEMITVVLEDIYQSHNASAVLRSCDVYGIQTVHVIENRNKFKIHPDIVLGSAKWLSIERWNRQENNTVRCLEALRKRGYKIIATTPHQKQKSLYDFEPREKSALLFGNELEGLGKEALELADEFLYIPMYGFTESLNISVAAATCLYEIRKKIMNTPPEMWQLSDDQKASLLHQWVRKSVKNKEAFDNYFQNQSFKD